MSCGLLWLHSLCSHHPAFLPSSNAVPTLWSEGRKGATLGFAEQGRLLPPIPKALEVRETLHTYESNVEFRAEFTSCPGIQNGSQPTRPDLAAGMC